MEEFMLPCMFKKFLGIDCIGCGLQRSIALVLKGEFVNAFYMFPAIYTTLLFFVTIGLHFFEKKHAYHKLLVGLAIFNASVMIIAYVYKMRFLY